MSQPAWIFDIQRFSVHDGPGIRTTVFFQGCPLRCEWCQNPESQVAARQLLLYGDLCLSCGACAQVCPTLDGQSRDASSYSETGHLLRSSTCTVCGRCADVCPAAARRIAGRQAEVDEIVDLALRDRSFYGDQGGVTLGGGEPLGQWAFARALAVRLHDEGVHVAIDTACLAGREVIQSVPEHVDLVLADLKLVTSEAHRRWTGANNAPILGTIRAWSRAMPGRLWISVPLIPGVQDETELDLMAEFIQSLDPSPPVRLIPYHRLGDAKYTALGRAIPAFPGSVEDLVERARAAFSRRGLHIRE
jgi:pyruvate formate lyase activating enzyme